MTPFICMLSIGGAVVLAVIAASSSDPSGPPTFRAGIPSAYPSASIGASTATGYTVMAAGGEGSRNLRSTGEPCASHAHANVKIEVLTGAGGLHHPKN